MRFIIALFKELLIMAALEIRFIVALFKVLLGKKAEFRFIVR